MARIKMEKLQAARMAKEALEMVSDLIDRYGSRLVGSESCTKTAEELADSLAPFTNRVHRETFSLHPDAFLGWIRILVAVYPVALVFLLISFPLIASIVSIGSLVIMVYEFFLYREVIDRWYPEKTGLNVYGVLDPEEEVHDTVIFSGHHDSAKVFNFYLHKPHLYLLRIGIGLGAYVLLTLTSVFQTVYELVTGTLFHIALSAPLFLVVQVFLLIALPWVLQLWNFAGKEGTPGAGDNLVSSAMAVQLARYFNSGGRRLQHTRVVYASFDGEEAGLRGARDFFTRHQHDTDVLGGTIHHFNVDCPYDPKHLFFLTSDINGSVKLSQEMATTCVGIAQSMGFSAFSQPIAFLTGGTDAAESAKLGYRAVSLMAMPWDNKERSSVYHTPQDLPEAVDIQALEETLSIAIKYIEQVDAHMN
jgi:hypothetical protein